MKKGKLRKCFKMSLLVPLSILILLFGLCYSSAVVAEEGIGSGGPIVEPLKCVCDGGCEHLRVSDCPQGLTFDMCRCCLVCARGEGEPCGGALGNCAMGLHCTKEQHLDDNNVSSPSEDNDKDTDEGTCSREMRGCESVEEQAGCTVGDEGDCICSTIWGCPHENVFLFQNRSQCESRMGFLIAKKDLDTFSPHHHHLKNKKKNKNSSSADISSSSSATEDDDCPPCPPLNIIPCPPDSYRLPSPIIQGREEDEESNNCCPPSSSSHNKCECIPGLHCPVPGCPLGSQPIIVRNGTGEAGHCCPSYECSRIQSKTKTTNKGDDEEGNKCNYGGRWYSSGERWSPSSGSSGGGGVSSAGEQDCSEECECHENGVISCKPIKCDLIPPECRLARTPKHQCCPVCVGCVTSTGGIYNNSQVWNEGPCTTCTCNDGRIQCHAAMCHASSSCSNPVFIPGECCPRCDNNILGIPNGNSNSASGSEQVCPFLDCHRKECPNGFRLDRNGCPTCKCITIKCPPMEGCKKSCPYGYQMDNHCSICQCRDAPNELGLKTKNSSRPSISSCRNGEHKNGDEWTDGCRRCICKEDVEFCTLISCPKLNCETPHLLHAGDCCPRCPDDEGDKPHLSKCGQNHSEGDVWNEGEGSCLTCTCHWGQVLCGGRIEECPPTPCSPDVQTLNSSSCCPSCPDGNHSNVGGAGAGAGSNCLSDDGQMRYSDGETWKVGNCESCSCAGGRIQCFSLGKCPAVDCEQPLLVKNQCCPICLGGTEHKGRRPSSSSGDDVGVGLLPPMMVVEPHCAILILSLLLISVVLGAWSLRQCLYRHRSRNSSSNRYLKKLPPSFHSSNSSSNTTTEEDDTSPPITPDCCTYCYKQVDCSSYNKYSSSRGTNRGRIKSAQLSEHKPLFNNSKSKLMPSVPPPSSEESSSPSNCCCDKV